MEINLGDLPFDVDFHPSDSLVATGLINGYLLLYRYAADGEPQRLLKVRAHKKSCRATRFINEGRDCSILAPDVETEAKTAHLENAHTAAVNRIINVTEATIASGDDAGCVKVWDTRQQSCYNTFQVHGEYISDMTFAADSMRLLATSGDGTLSVCSIRSNKVQAQSEFCEDEPLSLAIMKINESMSPMGEMSRGNGRKVICGTQSGTLLLYSWGFFKDCSDRFVDLSPNRVDALLKYDEDRLVTGSSNGLISLVGILPNRIIEPIAEHSEFPVEHLAFSHDKKLLGSVSHANMLKLWDMDELLQGSSSVTGNDTAASDSDGDSDDDGMDVDSDLANVSKGTKRKNTGIGNGKASSSSFGNFYKSL